MSSGTRSRENESPHGPEHKPEAVKAQKARRLRAFMAALRPGVYGSAAYRRRRDHH